MQVYSYFKNNKLFFGSQYGFKDENSTELASLEFVDKTLKQLDTGEIPIAIFLDLSKVFDTLNHDILLHKLQHYGIGKTPLQWFSSYLNNRRQYVNINDINSSTLNLSTGVPQGSILGPLLFIIYI